MVLSNSTMEASSWQEASTSPSISGETTRSISPPSSRNRSIGEENEKEDDCTQQRSRLRRLATGTPTTTQRLFLHHNHHNHQNIPISPRLQRIMKRRVLAAISIQACARGYLYRKRYGEAEEEEDSSTEVFRTTTASGSSTSRRRNPRRSRSETSDITMMSQELTGMEGLSTESQEKDSVVVVDRFAADFAADDAAAAAAAASSYHHQRAASYYHPHRNAHAYPSPLEGDDDKDESQRPKSLVLLRQESLLVSPRMPVRKQSKHAAATATAGIPSVLPRPPLFVVGGDSPVQVPTRKISLPAPMLVQQEQRVRDRNNESDDDTTTEQDEDDDDEEHSTIKSLMDDDGDSGVVYPLTTTKTTRPSYNYNNEDIPIRQPRRKPSTTQPLRPLPSSSRENSSSTIIIMEDDNNDDDDDEQEEDPLASYPTTPTTTTPTLSSPLEGTTTTTPRTHTVNSARTAMTEEEGSSADDWGLLLHPDEGSNNHHNSSNKKKKAHQWMLLRSRRLLSMDRKKKATTTTTSKATDTATAAPVSSTLIPTTSTTTTPTTRKHKVTRRFLSATPTTTTTPTTTKSDKTSRQGLGRRPWKSFMEKAKGVWKTKRRNHNRHGDRPPNTTTPTTSITA